MQRWRMKAHLVNLWDSLRTSYWLVPTLSGIAALILTLVMSFVDSALATTSWSLPPWLTMTTESARSSASAITGAMVAVAATVFSITILTLSLTSQQFGPRLLRRFMVDFPTQLTLGILLSTSLYCLLLLPKIQATGKTAEPQLSVMVGILLAVTSMAMLIYFIHHVAVIIQAPHVVASVAKDLNAAIDRLFPLEKSGDCPKELNNKDSLRRLPASADREVITVASQHEGYIQGIDTDNLLRIAEQNEWVLALRSRPGQFIAAGAPLIDVWVGERSKNNASRLCDLSADLNNAIIVGIRRTPRQDVVCAIKELVEVAVRSLSPGINDPFTAADCVDRLGAALARLAEKEIGAEPHLDDENTVRLVICPLHFDDILDAAFDQIRQHSRRSVAVTIRLLEALQLIASRVTAPDDVGAVKKQAALVVKNAADVPEEKDRNDIEDRYRAVVAATDLDDYDRRMNVSERHDTSVTNQESKEAAHQFLLKCAGALK